LNNEISRSLSIADNHIDVDNDNDNNVLNTTYNQNHSASRKILRPTTAAVIRQDFSNGNSHTTNTRFSQSHNEDHNDDVVTVDDDDANDDANDDDFDASINLPKERK
jgi:hypothetical protein